MTFYRCFYHIVWATKERAPRIDAAFEAMLYPLLTRESQSMGCELLAINGVADHVHLVMVIPPMQAVAVAVK